MKNKLFRIYVWLKRAWIISNWLPVTIIVLTTFSLAGLFLLPESSEVPMGDSYIHFVYAKNLVDYHEFSYNPGHNEGIGTTSCLWVLLLAVFYYLGVPPVIASTLLGLGLQIFSGYLIYLLALDLIPHHFGNRKKLLALVIALLSILPGSMIWIALSGMETMLFITLGLLALQHYQRGKWFVLGATLGLFTLTRIEGIILTGAMVMVELVRRRRLTVSVFKILLPLFILILPWLIFLLIREGVPFTRSFSGRLVTLDESEKLILANYPQLKWIINTNPIYFMIIWTYFVLMHLTGAISIPSPAFLLGEKIIGIQVKLPWAGLFVGIFLCLPLIYRAVKAIFSARKKVSLPESQRWIILVILLWLLGHNLAYALFLPQPGAAGRYIPFNQMIFWNLLFFGALVMRSKRLRWLSLGAVISLVVVSMCYWHSVYQVNVEYIKLVRRPSAEWINKNYPAPLPVGATDLGPIKYYSDHPIIDLLGHVNKDIAQFRSDGGSTADYLENQNLCYLMLFGSKENNGLDYGALMDLKNDPRFDLVDEVSFSVPVEDWILGIGSSPNYTPVVHVYRVDWHKKVDCYQ